MNAVKRNGPAHLAFLAGLSLAEAPDWQVFQRLDELEWDDDMDDIEQGHLDRTLTVCLMYLRRELGRDVVELIRDRAAERIAQRAG